MKNEKGKLFFGGIGVALDDPKHCVLKLNRSRLNMFSFFKRVLYACSFSIRSKEDNKF